MYKLGLFSPQGNFPAQQLIHVIKFLLSSVLNLHIAFLPSYIHSEVPLVWGCRAPDIYRHQLILGICVKAQEILSQVY